MKISSNKILITGGASGIGLGLTKRFLKENNTVIICGRRESLLKEIAGLNPGLITRTCDLSLPGEREELFSWINREHSDLNVLINNAGIQMRTSVDDDYVHLKVREEIAINVEAPIHLTSLFLKMKAAKAVMNVTSGLAFTPLIPVAFYSATKAFLHSYTLSLRHLVKDRNIEVIEIIPPALNTDLGGKGAHDFAPPVEDFINIAFEQLKQGKIELCTGFSEAMTQAGPQELKAVFDRMNGHR